MRQFELTFIVDPVLSGDEINATAQTYVDLHKKEGAEIVHVAEMGLRQLAYPINNRTTGIYYCIEYAVPSGEINAKIELALRRDERIMRFLAIKLDKYGIKYNDDKRNGKIGTRKRKETKKDDRKDDRGRSRSGAKVTPKPKPAPKPAAKPAPVAVAPAAVAEEEE